MAAADLFIDMNNNMEDERPKIQTGRYDNGISRLSLGWDPPRNNKTIAFET